MLQSKSILLVLLLGLSPAITQGQQPRVGDEVRKLLCEMDGHRSTKPLATLFEVGEIRIDDLIGALGDPDEKTKLNAQIVIRYLGSDKGMTAWSREYRSDKAYLTGPIPIPLQKTDYELIRSFYLRANVLTEALMDAYLFALALDGSAQARQLMYDVIANAKKYGFKLDELRYLQVAAARIAIDADLGDAVLQQATFLPLEAREYSTAKVIAYTANKDKALVEIHVNRGALAQEWWHVVVRRSEDGWKFFSITQVAVS